MELINKIHGSEIRAAIFSEKNPGLTKVWCDDGSKHLVYGYTNNEDGKGYGYFQCVVGYWIPGPNGEYLGPTVKEIVTRPYYLKALTC